MFLEDAELKELHDNEFARLEKLSLFFSSSSSFIIRVNLLVLLWFIIISV